MRHRLVIGEYRRAFVCVRPMRAANSPPYLFAKHSAASLSWHFAIVATGLSVCVSVFMHVRACACVCCQCWVNTQRWWWCLCAYDLNRANWLTVCWCFGRCYRVRVCKVNQFGCASENEFVKCRRCATGGRCHRVLWCHFRPWSRLVRVFFFVCEHVVKQRQVCELDWSDNISERESDCAEKYAIVNAQHALRMSFCRSGRRLTRSPDSGAVWNSSRNARRDVTNWFCARAQTFTKQLGVIPGPVILHS